MSEAKKLDKQIASLQTQLSTLPEGKLVCTRNKNRYKWYLSNGKNVTYLPKSQRHMAEQLALKKYLTLALEDATHEKKALDFYLRHHSGNHGEALQNLVEMPEYQSLLSTYLKPLTQELLHWTNSPYERNNKYPEQLTHITKSGYYVRSKSELLIDLALHSYKIPFRYECALTLGSETIYPDFTIRHPKTGKTYYWEHFGLMDDPAYCKNTCSKLNFYTSNGIIPTIHLITTYETKQHPLGIEQIDTIIQEYFL